MSEVTDSPAKPLVDAGQVNRRIGRSSAGLMAAHALSYGARVFKMLLIAHFFGMGVELESYQAALNVPNVILGILQGAMLTALVPILIELRTRSGERSAAQLWTRFGLLMTGGLCLLALGLGVGANWIAGIITEPGIHDIGLTTHTFRLLMGYLILYNLVQYLTLIYHSHHRFSFPMLMALPNFAVGIGALVLWIVFVRVEIMALVVSLYAGTLTHLTLLIINGCRVGILKPAGGRPEGFDRATKNMSALVLSGLVSPATLVTVDIIMAAPIDRGIATLWYAYAIFMFPVTVGVMNLGIVMLPFLAGQVAERDWKGLSHTVSLSSRVLMFVTVPAAVGLWLVSDPLIEVLLQRGEFTHADTLLVGSALRAYSWGLVFAGFATVVTKIFNAMQRVRAILVVSAIAFAVKIALNFLLRDQHGASGLAFATGCFYAINFALLALWVWKTIPLRLEGSALRTATMACWGAVVMICAVLGARHWLTSLEVNVAVVLVAEILTGAAVWVGFALCTRMKELGMLWRLIKVRKSPI